MRAAAPCGGPSHLDSNMINSSAVAAALLAVSALAAAAPPQGALATVMTAVGDVKAFRMKSSQFDALVAPYCKKTEQSADEYGVLAEYTCRPDTGITHIKLDSRGEAGPGKSYIMYIVIDMPIDRYAPVREQLGKQLGKPRKGNKDYGYWPYGGDKELSRNGNPVIMLSRDPSDRTATFQLALEQGP